VLAIVAGSSFSRATEDVPLSSHFGPRILAIDEEYAHWDERTILEDEILFVLPEFSALAEQSDNYVDECLKFLAERSHTNQQRRIAIYSMHKLQFSNWIYFVNRVLDLHDQSLASAYEVMDVILPMPGLSDHVINNFLNRDVRAVLYRTRNMRDLDAAEKNSITTILFGVVYVMKWLEGPVSHN
jgi:hypothetical protein